jgi:protein-disulfide isomerase
MSALERREIIWKHPTMLRRFLVRLIQRTFLLLVLVCLGCSAQSASPDLTQLLERHVRAHYSLPPEVKVVVGPLRPSEFPNYDAVTITIDSGRKQEFEFLVSKDHQTLVRFTKMDLSKDPYAEIMKKIDVTGRPVRGNRLAKVTVVNYDDFECPFCSGMHQTLFPELFKEYGDRVQFIYKDYPLEEIHPWAVRAAVDANCLAAQNQDAYWALADYLHANQRDIGKEKTPEARNALLDQLAAAQGQRHGVDETKLQACLKAQDEKPVRLSMREAEAVGVEATPTMFVNGQKIDGAVGPDKLRAALDRALKDAGVPAPEHKPAAEAVPPLQPSK